MIRVIKDQIGRFAKINSISFLRVTDFFIHSLLIRKIFKCLFYVALLIATSACSDLLVGSQFFTQGSLFEGIDIESPNQKIFRTGEVAVFKVQIKGRVLKTNLTKKNIKLQGRDLEGCETQVVNGNTPSPQIHVYGCKTLSNDLSFLLSGKVYTKLNGKEPVVNLQSDEIIFDNSTPFEFKVEIDQSKVLYLSALNNIDRHFRVYWGDGKIDFFRKGLSKDKLFHVYEKPGTYDVSISGNFKNFYSSRVYIYRDRDGDNNVAKTWNKGEKATINLASKVKPPIMVDIGGMEQIWIEKETDKIEIEFNHENVSFIGIESEILSKKDITGVTNSKRIAVYGNYTDGNNAIDRCLSSSFGLRAVTLKSVKELGSVGWNNMKGLFCGAKNLIEVSGGDTSQVTNMSYMFRRAFQAAPDASGWDTSNVTDMSYMFAEASKANPDTSGWVTSKVTNMEAMFVGAREAEPITTTNMATGVWDTSNVITMESMFLYATKANPDTSGWVTSNVTNMNSMFRRAYEAEPITTTNMATGVWDTSNVINMVGMFEYAINANPDTSGWVTSNVIAMAAMFRFAHKAEPVTTTDMATGVWDTSNVVDMFLMFQDAFKANPDVSGWVTSSVGSMGVMFSGAREAEPVTTTNMATGVWDTSNVTNMGAMFRGASKANPDVSGWVTSKVTSMDSMFEGALEAEPVTTTDMATGVWDTSNVKNMKRMFDGATKANPDVSGWVTSKVTDMWAMFRNASQAEPVTTTDMAVGVWDTSKVTNMASMFAGASKADPYTSGWITSRVTNMAFMFDGASKANPDTSGWVTSEVTNMGFMFRNASQSNPDISDWDFGSIFFGGTNDKYNRYISGLGFFFSSYYINLTTATYSNFLINLANTQAESCAVSYINPNEICQLDVVDLKYNSSAQSARDALIDKGWSIIDGGLID